MKWSVIAEHAHTGLLADQFGLTNVHLSQGQAFLTGYLVDQLSYVVLQNTTSVL